MSVFILVYGHFNPRLYLLIGIYMYPPAIPLPYILVYHSAYHIFNNRQIHTIYKVILLILLCIDI